MNRWYVFSVVIGAMNNILEAKIGREPLYLEISGEQNRARRFLMETFEENVRDLEEPVDLFPLACM